jgi:hypothetical protein
VSDAADRTGQVDRAGEPDVGAGGTEHDGDLAGLDAAVQVGTSRALRWAFSVFLP